MRKASPETRVLVVIGTRPEAIKLAPVIDALARHGAAVPRVCLTGQHRELLAQALADFDVPVHHNLALMSENQGVLDLCSRMLAALAPVIEAERPDWVVVQGDTVTAMAGAMAGAYQRRPVAHVEAGLRTGNLEQPWPEEMNRRLIGQLARLHFAPTPRARANLLAEGVADAAIDVTGNTVVDALLLACRHLDGDPAKGGEATRLVRKLDAARPVVLVTAHRRENLDAASLDRIATALHGLAAERGCQVVFPFHPNPAVEPLVRRLAAIHPDLHVVEPFRYLPFVQLLRRADVILTDSGGIQEEATVLGKPVVVMRDATERPELIEEGRGVLAGTRVAAILDAVAAMLSGGPAGTPSRAFGDGHAAARIAARLLDRAGMS